MSKNFNPEKRLSFQRDKASPKGDAPKRSYDKKQNDKPNFSRSDSYERKQNPRTERKGDDSVWEKFAHENESQFERDDRKPRFKDDAFADRKPRFGGERDDRKPRFGGEQDDRKPRFKDDAFADRKPRFGGEHDDRKPRFKDDTFADRKPRFGGEHDDRKPRFKDDTFADRKPRFGGERDDRKSRKRISLERRAVPNLIDEIFDEHPDGIRLNKYLSLSGLCARRKADEFISSGQVMVNGTVVSAMGFRVQHGDVVTYKGSTIRPVKKVYVLLNKPKNILTTTDDPEGRKTVMDLVVDASPDRLYPVGRLDRNTTGLILLTNDGDLAQKMAHPSYEIRKLYHVQLDKHLTKQDMQGIASGVTLEDGLAEVDDIDYLEEGDKTAVGVLLHSGRNRVVRRIFAHLGYEVIKLDRVMYGSLTKKDIPRGKWRFLTDQEVIWLKHFKN